MTAAKTQDGGHSKSRTASEMYSNKDGGDRDEGCWRQDQKITAGETQVDDYIGTIHAR